MNWKAGEGEFRDLSSRAWFLKLRSLAILTWVSSQDSTQCSF